MGAGSAVQGYTSLVFWRGFTAFFDPIVETFGWSRAATAGALSLQRTEGGMISPFVGILLEKFGPRKVMFFGVFVTGLSFILMSKMTTLWHFYAIISLLSIGMSFGTFIVLVATVGDWFNRKRKLALSILMSASGAGGFAVPILVTSIENFGWRDVIFGVGIGFWLIGFISASFMRHHPEQYGLSPDGDKLVEDKEEKAKSLKNKNEFSLKQILKTRFFWQFSIILAFAQIVSSTNLLHMPALTNFGVPIYIAGLSIAGLALGDLIGRLSIGVIGEKISSKTMLILSFSLLTIGAFSLAFVNLKIGNFVLESKYLVPVFAICWGLGFGSSIPLRLSMLGDYFGRKNYGTIVGLTSTISAISAAIGPIFVGLSFDITGSYRFPFLFLGITVAIALPLIFSLQSIETVKKILRS